MILKIRHNNHQIWTSRHAHAKKSIYVQYDEQHIQGVRDGTACAVVNQL